MSTTSHDISVQAVEKPSVATPRRPGAGAAVGVLAFCCILWGWSFPAAQFGIRPFEAALRAATGMPAGDFAMPVRVGLSATFNAWRFALAAAVYALLTWRRQRGLTAAELRGGVAIGLFFAAGMIAQNIGLRYTVPSVSGFLTALLVVFAPLAQAVLLKKRVGGRIWVAVGLALAGTAILAQAEGTTAANTIALAEPCRGFGEALTVLGALFFTGEVLAIDHYGARADTARLTLIMFVVVAVVSGVAGAGLGTWPLYRPGVMAGLAGSVEAWWTLGTLVVFSSVVAVHLMNVYQPRIAPATAGVVYCLEPMFAAGFSVVCQTERLTGLGVAGGAVILAAVLLVAWPWGPKVAKV